MNLSRKQFDILACLERERRKLTQRSISQSTGMSLGSVNKALTELAEARCIDANMAVTPTGYEALEPYRAKRAIILAAEMGARLMPVTLNTPKPLIRIHGERIIDTLLDRFLSLGITEIYIVRGYLSDLFEQLMIKYPGLHFVDNPLYNESNNISSAILVRSLFSNAYVAEGDLYLQNPDLIRKYNYTSVAIGAHVDETDDLCFLAKNGVITDYQQGGEDCYLTFPLYYWDEADGKQLSKDLNKVYNRPGGIEALWDSVPMHICRQSYKVELRECTPTDIAEFDTYKQLQAIDSAYTISQ